jgi:predicted nucleotide-binding protein
VKSPVQQSGTPELDDRQIRAAIARLHRRLRDLDAFQPSQVKSRQDPNIDALEAGVREAVTSAFGHDTPEVRPYIVAANIDTAPIKSVRGTPHQDVIAGLEHGKSRAIALLGQAIRSLEERLSDQHVAQRLNSTDQLITKKRDIFIVHGHDSEAKKDVARVIERAGLNAVVLHEQTNGGRTIIEKFEKHGGSAGFAVVLLTPDDVGGTDHSNLRPRARQNVIGEMYWFAAKLGRSCVCALKKGDIEIPSDFAGVIYTEMDDRGAWKSDLLRELQSAGYDGLDWAKALA